MGTCEGYTCPVEHRAPQKVVSSQDAGRGRSAEKLAIAAMVHVRMHWRASRTGRHRDRCRESMATVRVHKGSGGNSELEHQICARRGRGRPRKPCFQGWEQGCECDLTPFQKFIFSVKKVRAPGLLTDLRKIAQCETDRERERDGLYGNSTVYQGCIIHNTYYNTYYTCNTAAPLGRIILYTCQIQMYAK